MSNYRQMWYYFAQQQPKVSSLSRCFICFIVPLHCLLLSKTLSAKYVYKCTTVLHSCFKNGSNVIPAICFLTVIDLSLLSIKNIKLIH